MEVPGGKELLFINNVHTCVYKRGSNKVKIDVLEEL